MRPNVGSARVGAGESSAGSRRPPETGSNLGVDREDEHQYQAQPEPRVPPGQVSSKSSRSGLVSRHAIAISSRPTGLRTSTPTPVASTKAVAASNNEAGRRRAMSRLTGKRCSRYDPSRPDPRSQRVLQVAAVLGHDRPIEQPSAWRQFLLLRHGCVPACQQQHRITTLVPDDKSQE